MALEEPEIHLPPSAQQRLVQRGAGTLYANIRNHTFPAGCKHGGSDVGADSQEAQWRTVCRAVS